MYLPKLMKPIYYHVSISNLQYMRDVYVKIYVIKRNSYIKTWDDNMSSSFGPGWVSCLDECMSSWTNKCVYPGHIYIYQGSIGPLATTIIQYAAAYLVWCVQYNS